MEKATPKEIQESFVQHGVCKTMDEAAHMLYDMGEIDSTTHEELLSEEERGRVYGA